METLEKPTISSPPSQTTESGEGQNPSSTPSDRSDPDSGIQEGGARTSNLESAPDQGRVGFGSEATVGGIEDGGFRVFAEGAGGNEKAIVATGSELKVGDGDSSAVEGVSTESCGDEGIRPREDIVRETEENNQGGKGDVLAGPAAGDEKSSGATCSELKVADGDSSAVEGVSNESCGDEGIRPRKDIVSETEENKQDGKGDVLTGPVDDGCPHQSNGPFSVTHVDSTVGFHGNSSRVEEVRSLDGVNSKEFSSSGVAPAVAADVCVVENVQDRTGDISEEAEKKVDEVIEEAPASLFDDKMQIASGDADARHQVAPKPVAFGGEEVACKEQEVKMVDVSDSAEGKEGVASESSLPAVAEAIVADVCLTENGQDPNVLEKKQNIEGDVTGAEITSLDEKQQIRPEIEAVDRGEDKVLEKAGISISKEDGGLDNESGLSAPAPLPEKFGISITEEGEGGLNNESGLPAPSPVATAADVCLPENGQNLRADAAENHTSVPGNEKGPVTEAAVSIADMKQNTEGDAGDVGITISDGKQQTVQELGGGGEDATSQGKKFLEESILGHENLSAEIDVVESESAKVTIMDICLPENGQEPGTEVVEMPIESDVLVVDEKHNSAGTIIVQGAVLSQQSVLESVTGEREQNAVEGNGSLCSGIVCHQDSCAEIEVTEPVSAPAAVTESEMMATHMTVLEMREGEGNEAGEPTIDLIDGKHNLTHDAITEGITSLDEKQQSAMDVNLPENRQNLVVEVSDMHVDNLDACVDDKLPAAAVDGEQQLGTISVASEIQQVTEEGGLSEDGVQVHDDVIADVEIRKSPKAEDMAVDVCSTDNAPALGDESAETHSVPEMVQTEVVESGELAAAPSDMKISSAANGAVDADEFLEDSCPSERNQSTLVEAEEADGVDKEKDADNVLVTEISVVDKEGQQITKAIAGEKKGAAEKDQPVEDGIRNHSDAGVEAMEINAPMRGAEENEEEDEVEEDEEQADEEEEQFSVGDFVWGKIKSHPWWPGLIYDPSDASDFARKYRRRDRLLVAYFGDGTFAWCYPSQLRPFNRHFERTMKQSSTKSFLNAVEEALSELSRCVESEMTCSCVSEEKKVKLAQPLAVNAGIKEGTTVPQGHIDDLSISEFDPANFIGRLKDIAPVVAVKDTLELTVLKSRLSAFYGAKGYSELPTYHLPRGISDTEEDARNLSSEEGQPRQPTDTPAEEDWASLPIGPGAGKSCSSDKRLQVSEDKIYQRRKRSVAELMADHIDMEFVNERHVKDELVVSDRPASSSKDHKKTKLSATEEEDSDFEKDASDEGKSVGKSASSSKRRKKGKHLEASNSTSDFENDDAGEEAPKVTSKSALSSKKRKNIKHSLSSPSTTAENKISDVENDDSGEEEIRTLDKCAPSSKTRKKTKHSESSPPSSPDNKVTFDDEINEGGAEEGAVLSSPRNRRRSRYLTAPYTMLAGQKSVVSTEDSETGNLKSPVVSRVGASISKIAVQLTGASQIVKSSGKKYQKKVPKEPNVENKIPGNAGPQTGRRSRKAQALKEEDVAADETFSDVISTPSDSIQPKGGRKGKSSVAENDSSGNDPYELKFGEKRVKEKEQTSLKNPKRKSRKSSAEDTAPHSAALLLTFEPGFALPSKDVLVEVFSKYGVLNESETEVMEDSGCAQVVFARSSDAEEAFNSSDKDTAFKPATVSYRLRYLSTASNVPEPDSPPSAADGSVAAPATENLAETQPLLYMHQSIESMMSLLSKFTGKEPGQAAKLTPTVRADLTVELGCLLRKVTSLLEDSRS